ncbi:MarR family transcriptional regulator [Lactobacillus sp. LC28-10]|uniref:MarR family transcriptional regulator n=1 Tax=Secundilactobacillus angelensis TaxID=2722706 RepID=A0ABX1L240_9LACO|nr:MarR family transcriptional regulator [Secundilactobacillus angelensis]MCH5463028.1 MarR family transcriptional regulator [Secundilactobacillus angelensis]NLR19494.1 MarR family transcriptional regulator [Secundilactobacillus angelensis]
MLVFNDYPVGASALRIVNAHESLIAKDIRVLGLYPGQDTILITLARSGQQAQNTLAKAMQVDHSTVAKSVRRLVNNGLAETGKSSQDGRVTLVQLTPAGLKLAKQVEQICQTVEEQSIQNLSPDEQAVFIKIANKICGNLEKIEV